MPRDQHSDRLAALPPLMLGGSLWAIRADALPRVLSAARAFETSHAPEPAAAAAASVAPQSGPGIAVIPLTGVLTPHGSFLSFLFGGGSGGVQGFREQLARAVADPQVAAVVLDVDSPGGSVGLVPEAAADVLAARDVKPVYAVANVQAASGAYYIASQASELYVTPSGQVGSIGVYYLHEDWSSFNEQFGVDVNYVYAGQYKTEGNPDEPLSDEARAAWQADADTLYQTFVNDVAQGRGATAASVMSDYGEGRVLLAQDALDAGMVDGIDTLQTVIGRALSEAATSIGPNARQFGRAHESRVPLAAAPRAGETEDEPEPAEPVETEPSEPEPAEPVATVDEPEVESEPEDEPQAAALTPERRAAQAALLTAR